MFPFMMEDLGELDEMTKLFVMTCEYIVKPEAFDYAKWKGTGLPTTSQSTEKAARHTLPCGRHIRVRKPKKVLQHWNRR